MGNCECGDTRFCGDASTLVANAVNSKSGFWGDREESEEVLLKIRTWQKESYSLFDYENQGHLKEQVLHIHNDGLVFRRNNEILLADSSQHRASDDVFMFRVLNEGGHYFLVNNLLSNHEGKEKFSEENNIDLTTKIISRRSKSHNESELLEEQQQSQILQFDRDLTNLRQTKAYEMGCKIWLVVKSVQKYSDADHGIRLRKGDIVKLGRVKLKIKEINFKNFNDPESNRLQSIDSSSSVEGRLQCRVCLGSTVTNLNPLVNPCKCAGTMKYIHLECLKTWLRQKLHSSHNEHCMIFMWKQLECELCKCNYPPIFKSDNVYYDLVELSKPKDIPYLLLEITQKKIDIPNNTESSQNTANAGVYIITFDSKRELRIGRAHETEVRINDISVSRLHATFKLVKESQSSKVDGEVYLQDTQSKFGTLLLMQKRLMLNDQLNGLEFQVSRSVMSLHIGFGDYVYNYQDLEMQLGRTVSQDDVLSDG